MNERYIKWYTPWLSREFEMLVFGGKRGLPLVLFPTSGARYYENKDFGLVGAIAPYIDNGKVTVYCPDGIIAFRHPDAVSLLISLSGSFFDGYHDDNIYFNSPYDYLPNMPDPWKYNHMAIIIGTGEWDVTRDESYRLSGVLNSKGIKHWLDDGKWRGHDWNYWQDMLPYYLSLL